MRRSAEFTAIVRNGRRVRCGTVVVHSLVPVDAAAEPAGATAVPAHVGLIVGRTVGGSVDRHRVSRRLRAQLAARLDRLPAGSGTVVRALPTARTAASRVLGADLDAALDRLGARA
jgi:ribonuclease P protein component